MQAGNRQGRFVTLILTAGLIAASAATAQQQPTGRAGTQAPAAAKSAQPPPAKPGAPAPSPGLDFVPPRTANPDQVVATVNGDTVTRGEVFKVVMHYFIPPGKESQAYNLALDAAINHHLLVQYVSKKGVQVSEKEVDGDIAKLEEELKANGSDLPSFMAGNDVTLADLRRQGKNILLFQKFIDALATDKALKEFVLKHPDVYNRTKIRASHIFLRVDPETPPETKAKIKAKLASIKREIEAKKTTFKDAADKYSEDQVNAEKHVGGDIGFFAHNQFNKRFEAAAFALKQGVVSEPVETDFGYHLILVTERKEGEPVKYEDVKEQVLEHYKQDLEERILADELKTAKITRKPMPVDFIPTAEVPKGRTGNPTIDPASKPAGNPSTKAAKAQSPR
jgi:peptidyl-prolyl cis-trans isomerase C